MAALQGALRRHRMAAWLDCDVAVGGRVDDVAGVAWRMGGGRAVLRAECHCGLLRLGSWEMCDPRLLTCDKGRGRRRALDERTGAGRPFVG